MAWHGIRCAGAHTRVDRKFRMKFGMKSDDDNGSWELGKFLPRWKLSIVEIQPICNHAVCDCLKIRDRKWLPFPFPRADQLVNPDLSVSHTTQFTKTLVRLYTACGRAYALQRKCLPHFPFHYITGKHPLLSQSPQPFYTLAHCATCLLRHCERG